MAQTARGWTDALTAATAFKIVRRKFNALLHPRGADGRFIDKNGSVKWRDKSGLWKFGTVSAINNNNGTVQVEVVDDRGAKSIHLPDKLYGAPARPKKIATTGMKQVGPQGGSNPGGIFEDVNGDTFYVKRPQTPAHVANEIAAHRIYSLAGVPVPDVTASVDDSQFISRIENSVPWDSLTGQDLTDALAEIRKNFVVDAWLGNWDVAQNGDNVRITEDGVPLRVDTGGALDYRARGGLKPTLANSGSLDPDVKELTTMRQFDHAGMYKGLTRAEEEEAVERILAIAPDTIRDAIKDAGAPSRLADDLITRRAWLATHYGYQLPETTPAGKALLNPPTQSDGSPSVAPSLKAAVRKTTPGTAVPYAPGSPVWLRNKAAYGKGLGDIWTVQSISADGKSLSIKSKRGNNTLTVNDSDLEPLRANYASVASKFSGGEQPEMGDKVTLPDGTDGEIVEIFPLYARVKLADGKKKVVAVEKLTLKPSAPDAGTSTLYNKPFEDDNALIQQKYRAAAEAQVRAGNAPKQQFNTADLHPTQPEDQTNAAGTGAGPKDLDPIVVRVGGTDYLLDGHHRAAGQTTLDAHFIDFDSQANAGLLVPDPLDDAEGKPFDFDNHDFFANPHPTVFSLTHDQPTVIFDYDPTDKSARIVLRNGKTAVVNLDRVRQIDTVDPDALKKLRAADKNDPAAIRAAEQAKIDAMTLADVAKLKPLVVSIPSNLTKATSSDSSDFELKPGERLFKIDIDGSNDDTSLKYVIQSADGEYRYIAGGSRSPVIKGDEARMGFYKFLWKSYMYSGSAKDITPPEFARAAELLGQNKEIPKPSIPTTFTSTSATGTVRTHNLPSDITNNPLSRFKTAGGHNFFNQISFTDNVTGETHNFITDTVDVWYYGTQTFPYTDPVKLTPTQQKFYFDRTQYGIAAIDTRNKTPGPRQTLKDPNGNLVIPQKYTARRWRSTDIASTVQMYADFNSDPDLLGVLSSTQYSSKISNPDDEAPDHYELAPGTVVPNHANPVNKKSHTPAQALNYQIPVNLAELLRGTYDESFVNMVFDRHYTTTSPVAQKAPDGTEHADPAFYEFVNEHGGDALPVRLSDAEFQAYVAKNKTKTLYRGVAGDQFMNDLRKGTLYFGRGIYGNGTYSSNVSGTASSYGGSTTAFTVAPNAKFVQYDDVLQAQVKAIGETSDQFVDQMARLGGGPSVSQADKRSSTKVANSKDAEDILQQELQYLKGPSRNNPSFTEQKERLINRSREFIDHYEALGWKLDFGDLHSDNYSGSHRLKLEFSHPSKSNSIQIQTDLVRGKVETVASDKMEYTLITRFSTRNSGTPNGELGSETGSLARDHSIKHTYDFLSALDDQIYSPSVKVKTLKRDGTDPLYNDLAPLFKSLSRMSFMQDPGRFAFLMGVDAYEVPQYGSESYFIFTNRNKMIVRDT